jgi:hypothetical protein
MHVQGDFGSCSAEWTNGDYLYLYIFNGIYYLVRGIGVHTAREDGYVPNATVSMQCGEESWSLEANFVYFTTSYY